MKNLLKPFSYTLVASAVAMAISQPVFASNVQQQSKKPNTKVSTTSVQNERSEIERITY